MFALLLTGCIFISNEELRARLDSLPGPMRIQEISPNWGQTGTRAQFLLSGGDFSGDTTVMVGDQEASILKFGVNELSVEVDGARDAGQVDVTVTREGDGKSATLPKAFTWIADQTGTTGLVGTLETVTGPAAPNPPTSAWLQFTENASAGAIGRLGSALPGCTNPGSTGDFSAVGLDVGEGTVRISPSEADAPISLDSQANGVFAGTTSSPLVVGSYDLVDISTTGLPALTATGLFAAPDPMQLTEPELGGGVLAYRDDFWLRWVPIDADDLILIRLTGAGLFTTCTTEDDGEVKISGEDLEGWESGELQIQIGRVRAKEGILSWNNAKFSTVTASWMAGTVQME